MSFNHSDDSVLDSMDATRFIHEHGFVYRDEEGLSQTLKCPICSEPWIQPVQVDPCGHIFCSVCITTWTSTQPTCPVDRTRILPSSPDVSSPSAPFPPLSRSTSYTSHVSKSHTFKRPPTILTELVDELVVLCSLGCGWSGRRDAWKGHLERDCEEVEVNGARRGGDEAPPSPPEDHDDDDHMSVGSPPSTGIAASTIPFGSPKKLDSKSDAAYRARERQLLRRISNLKGEAKSSNATIEVWKSKVIKLEAQLAEALKADPTVVEPTYPEEYAGHVRLNVAPDMRRSGSRGSRGALGIDGDAGAGLRQGEGRVHPARCDRCQGQIRGVRYKCFKCPDFDICDNCIGSMGRYHQGHDFVPIRDPADVHIRSLPEWKVVHPDVSCDMCQETVVGPRYRCNICLNFDLCYKCVARPDNRHPQDHPMTRYLQPSNGHSRYPLPGL